jgi:DNA-binding LytR/AlgR family response regulator
MKVLIIEDEPLAAERLVLLLKEYDTTIEILAIIDNIADTIDWLRHKAAPDVILLDIHLSDGQSFEIFQQVEVQTPIIFVTAYDQYALQAFDLNSIHYLLKPVSLPDLAKALQKLQQLQLNTLQIKALWQQLLPTVALPQKEYKNRFLVKVGDKMFYQSADKIAYFFAEEKMVYLVNEEGKKYIIEHSLEALEELLNPQDFFRINRKFLVHCKAVREIRPYHNSRLRLLLHPNHATEAIVSRERVSDFKTWMGH